MFCRFNKTHFFIFGKKKTKKKQKKKQNKAGE